MKISTSEPGVPRRSSDTLALDRRLTLLLSTPLKPKWELRMQRLYRIYLIAFLVASMLQIGLQHGPETMSGLRALTQGVMMLCIIPAFVAAIRLDLVKERSWILGKRPPNDA